MHKAAARAARAAAPASAAARELSAEACGSSSGSGGDYSPTVAANMRLWHSAGARSKRCLWTLHELGGGVADGCELITMPFPPRVTHPDYLKVNVLGTASPSRAGAAIFSCCSPTPHCGTIAARLPQRRQHHQPCDGLWTGTIPYFEDNPLPSPEGAADSALPTVQMTESVGICLYLAQKHSSDLAVRLPPPAHHSCTSIRFRAFIRRLS